MLQMRNSQMPEINLTALGVILTADEFKTVKGIVATRGKNKGRLRASKPKVARHLSRIDKISTKYGVCDRKIYQPDLEQGKTAYVWRMVAFSASPISQHHCMPCTADFDLPGESWKESMVLAKELDELVDKVLATIPKELWYGVKRWKGLV